MGRLRDKLTGTRHPEEGVPVLSGREVRSALLALNGPAARYRVRNALPADQGDLVAEYESGPMGVRLKTTMRFVPERHEVRFLHERWEKRSPVNSRNQYGRGHGHMVYRLWHQEEDGEGGKRRVETFHLDTREMTDPLRDAVLGGGWVWRGVLKL